MKQISFTFFVLLLLPFLSLAQLKKLTGRVTDASDGQPLPGVSIAIKGSSKATSSGTDGAFSIDVNNNDILQFRFIGYKAQEINVANLQVLNVQLVTDNQALGEVIVVGYGTQQKREVTGSIASVRASDIQDLRVIGLDQALQGKAPGVQVTNNTGAPGSAVSIRIRGTTSLSSGNEPLYVVDGVPINNALTGSPQAGNDLINGLSGVNPNDIESMDILKDAAASAIYGARAANGVVLITTKRGKIGKPDISFNVTTGISQQNNRYDVLNSNQFAILANELRAVRNEAPFFTQAPAINTNWQDQIFRDAYSYNANASIRGGTDKTKYAISGGYLNNEGVIINSKYERLSFRSNIDQEINKNIKLGVNVYVARTANNRLRNDGGPNFQDAFNGNNIYGPNVLSSALVFNPTIPVYNADGTYARDTIAGNSNPVALASEADLLSKNLRLIGNVFVDWNIFKPLKYRLNVGTDIRDENENFFFPPNPAALGSGRATSGYYKETLALIEHTLNYSPNLGENHKFEGLAGFTLQKNRIESNFTEATGLTSDKLPIVQGTNTRGSSGKTSNGILSYIGRTTYNYKGKYFATASARLDASSRFGDNNKYAFFPAFSAGWIISDEKFLVESKTLSFLKLRGSYGFTGNQEIGNFGYLASVTFNAPYLGIIGGAANNPVNNDYSWEKTEQIDIGLDIGLFKNRVNLVIDAYQKKTSKLILFIPLPNTTGFGGLQGNAGTLQNRGLEFGLNTENFTGKFKWNSNFNISFNRNKILVLIDNQDILQGSFGYSNIAREGEQLSFFLYQTDGVNPANGQVIRRDINRDGTINDADRSIVGSPLPKFIGGFTNNFSYKGFDLSAFLQWSYGNKIYNQTREFLEGLGSGYYNQSTIALRRWRNPGDITDVPKAGNDNNATGYASTRYMEDGSFLRLKNVTLSYNLPAKLLAKSKIRNVRVFLSGQNLATITNYTGLDPEVNHFTGNGQFNNIALGFDNGSYPQAKTYAFGLSANF